MIKTKYPIDSELLEKCVSLPAIPKSVIPILQKLLKLYSNKLFRDRNLDISSYLLDSGAKLYKLEKPGCSSKKALYAIHGGGFAFPHAPHHIALAKEYAERLGIKVFLIDYRLAPKHKHPSAEDDCFAGFEYMLNNQEKLGIDINDLVIGGDSAGGYLAVTTTLKMQEKYGITPKGNLLMFPVCDSDRNSESMQAFSDTPMCNTRDMDMYGELLASSRPLTLMDRELQKIPRTYIEAAEFDCLRDGAIVYKDKLVQLGIDVEFHYVEKAMHGFDYATDASITRKQVENRLSFVERCLSDE